MVSVSSNFLMLHVYTEANVVEKVAKKLSEGIDNEEDRNEQLQMLLASLRQSDTCADNQSQWDYNFRSILFALLEVLRESQVSCALLYILKEIVH